MPVTTKSSRKHVATPAQKEAAQARRERFRAIIKQIAAMERCDVPACQHRGTWKTMGVLLCGRHLAKVKAEHNRSLASVGGMGLFLTVSYDRASILDMAQRTNGRA